MNPFSYRATRWLALAAMASGLSLSAHAQDVRVARQYGIAYIPLMIMQER